MTSYMFCEEKRCCGFFHKRNNTGGYVNNKWYCDIHIHDQPERASERDRKVCGAPNTPTKGSESSRND